MKKITSKNLATLSLVSTLALSGFESLATTPDVPVDSRAATIREETKKLGHNLATYSKEKSSDTAAVIEHGFREAWDKIEQLADEFKEKSKEAYDKLHDKYLSAKEKSAEKAYAAHQNTLAQLKKLNKDLDAKIGRTRAKRTDS